MLKNFIRDRWEKKKDRNHVGKIDEGFERYKILVIKSISHRDEKYSIGNMVYNIVIL